MLTQKRLKELIYYNPQTGAFKWIASKGGCYKGRTAGTLTSYGYQAIVIDRVQYRAHRLAWLFVYGKWPSNGIDHINNVKTDNKIINLREATASENMKNSKLIASNTSGIKGVRQKKNRKSWIASLSVNGKVKNIGSFSNVEEATKAIKLAREFYHGEFANHG